MKKTIKDYLDQKPAKGNCQAKVDKSVLDEAHVAADKLSLKWNEAVEVALKWLIDQAKAS